MIREAEFRISRRPYAVDLSSLRALDDRAASKLFTVDAAWFRRSRGVTVACVGVLWDFRGLARPGTADAASFLASFDDGRYGGYCHGRWDGQRYWGAQEPDVIEQHLALLRPMLANFPQVPPGYDGWWRF